MAQPPGHGTRTQVRLITCGSVDDGKSTLMGRLLHDAGAVPADQIAALPHTADGPDFAWLLDGLAAEREQGITIDVAYRAFTSARRAYIVADCPGHEQYTRNMVTGASAADVAVILVDATRGVLSQTRRHALLVSLMGLRHIILAVTKMDLVGYQQAPFEAIVADFNAYAAQIGVANVVAIPLCGTRGDMVAQRSAAMAWYAGPTLLDHLDSLAVDTDAAADQPFRLPVQRVTRAADGSRSAAGTIVSGTVRVGDPVCVAASGRHSRVGAILSPAGAVTEARAGQSVTLTLADAVDCGRGDVIAAADQPPASADQFEATLIWLDPEPLVPGRGYWLKLATQEVTATVQPPKHQLNVATLEHLAARTLELNAIGRVVVSTDQRLVFEPYAVNRALGGFILVDKEHNRTVAAGLIAFSLRRAHTVVPQALTITPAMRAGLLRQRPAVLWFTGLSGAGKSTIANRVDQRLHALGRQTVLLDGDNIRHGLNRDLGFTEADRIENIRRVAEVARLMADAGLIVLVAFISPFRAERELARNLVADADFFEIFVDTPLAEAEKRDPKGLYKRARAGEIRNFTGLDSPYEAPEAPDVRIDTTRMTVDDAAEAIIAALLGRVA